MRVSLDINGSKCFLCNRILKKTPGIFCDGFLLCCRRRIVSISNPYCLPFCFPLSECSASSSLNSTISSSVQSSTAQIFPAFRAERVQIRDTSRIDVVNGRQTVAPRVVCIFYHTRAAIVNFSKNHPAEAGWKTDAGIRRSRLRSVGAAPWIIPPQAAGKSGFK